MANKILIIALEFPPIRASNDRTYHFCRYLPEFGWTPTVISPRMPGRWMLHDNTLQIPPSIEVHDAPAHQTIWVARMHYLLKLLPDTNLFMFTSYFAGDRILSREGAEYRAVYATTPSSSGLFSAYFLANKYGKPLVLDFRDPFYPPLLYRPLFRRLLHHARKIITTTEVYRDVLIRQGADARKMEIIPNGTDVGTIERIRGSGNGVSRSSVFTIVYAGVLIPLYRLKALLKAVAKLTSFNMRVVIVGRLEDDREGLVEFVRENGLQDTVEFRGRLSQEETIKVLLQATVAYNGSAHPGGVGGKVYDYLACGLPILGYNPQGSATYSFINEHNVGLTTDTEAGLVDNLRKLCNDPTTVDLLSKRALEIARAYDRRNLAKKLSDVLTTLTCS